MCKTIYLKLCGAKHHRQMVVLLNGVAELDAVQGLLASHLGLALTGQEPRCTGRQKSHAIHRTWGLMWMVG